MEENSHIIKDAVYKELSRNGQVFILYNRVETIESKKAELERLIPEARIVVAHGQMGKDDLENRMIDFIDHKYDILLCTTIIETGIDIPNATVILIENAERFGLASLHQMRGRVGRGTDESFCILICGSNSESAYQRLQIMSNVSDGFLLANEDLKMRGPGDMLGIKQHGQLSERLIASLKNPKMVSQAIELLDFMNSNPRQKNNDFFVISDSKIC